MLVAPVSRCMARSMSGLSAYFLILAVLALSLSLWVRLLADNLGIDHQPKCAHCCHNIWLPQLFLRPVVWLFSDLETVASKVAP